MQLNDYPLFARDDCVPCPSQPPPCTCATNQQCVTILQCVEIHSRRLSTTNFLGGILEDATRAQHLNVSIIHRVLMALEAEEESAEAPLPAVSLAHLLWLAFSWARTCFTDGGPSPSVLRATPSQTSPASADAVLKREDPYEKDSRASSMSPAVHEAYQRYNEMMLLAQQQQQQQQAAQYVAAAAAVAPAVAGPSLDRRQSDGTSVLSDPFKDAQSILTTSASTQSTNVIPIHLVPHGFYSIFSPKPNLGRYLSEFFDDAFSSASCSRPEHRPLECDSQPRTRQCIKGLLQATERTLRAFAGLRLLGDVQSHVGAFHRHIRL